MSMKRREYNFEVDMSKKKEGGTRQPILVHLYKPVGLGFRGKEISESWADPMAEVNESHIDSDNHIIKNVCIFGKAKSENGYNYEGKAIDKIATLANGVKVFLNHPSKQEQKDRDGVRDVRDWAGIYYNPRREGEKVFGDLHAREAYWDLLEDIAIMKPAKVGNSINARVRVFVDNAGKESVVDVDRLHSTDIVASGATIENLWESVDEKLTDEQQEIMQKFRGNRPRGGTGQRSPGGSRPVNR